VPDSAPCYSAFWVPMKTRRAMIAAVVLLLTACVAVPVPAPVPVPGVVIDPADPYVFSPPYCVGCWYGQ
jgi:hypothetical protein